MSVHAASRIPGDIRTPAYVLDAARLEDNLGLADRLRAEVPCKVLLATKSFALPAAFPLMRDHLDGTTASGLYEARVGREEFGKEVHVYSPAYAPGEIDALVRIADHVYFNSPRQIEKHLAPVQAAGLAVGLRINPGYSNATLGGDLYDPCAPGSRFGTIREELDAVPWDVVDILHVHALCESLHEGSVGLIEHVAREFGPYLRRVRAVNFGGGHFIGKTEYDIGALIRALRTFRDEFDLDLILEPGSGLVVDAGWLVATVLDIHHNEKTVAILDASASTHMPDVLEVPYTPDVIGADEPGAFPHEVTLAGKTCMTGDVIGEYSFPKPLHPGDRIVFKDMMQYSFVKNTTFNGMPLPDLAVLERDGAYRVLRSFDYGAFRNRLG